MARLVKVAALDEMQPGSMKSFEVEGRLILLANVEGVFYAMDALCSHEEWDLAEGVLEGRKVVCPGHAAVWDLEKGEAEFDEELRPLRTYRTVVSGGFVHVELD
ncbi:MAG: Rieske 2Fe-2S domain-containing protein [Candidatus Caldarchaeum sp.]|nr:Rieske 2Fe-2S domain-containing protein [Candidatus Caldarchaeum sp.]MCS7133501.1 Rieske 2Fe-2S domain-containing protein [Candidatus Caldarchaeum sp.]MCX8200693.1 Rieske 2Fe-2S domain-containing protein [Candidatus Caldarchaeum sp.]MDW8063271.1 Rieske 2Fe-2S domain-containing protein [Candidatus Caldarchaeum sp.]MDW8435778.1 Rieske 2Fe-2S domain-containing protein [Candidatus Caldarchaeum sp.]